MDSLSAAAVISELVSSLDSTLRFLRNSRLPFTSDKLGVNFAPAEVSLRASYLELVGVQSNLRMNCIYSQPNELTGTLRDVGEQLDRLKEGLQNVEKYCTKLEIRRPTRVLLYSDTEDAMSRISLVQSWVRMFKAIQGQGKFPSVSEGNSR